MYLKFEIEKGGYEIIIIMDFGKKRKTRYNNGEVKLKCMGQIETDKWTGETSYYLR